MDNHPGSYLLNVSSFDDGKEDIGYENPLDHGGTK